MSSDRLTECVRIGILATFNGLGCPIDEELQETILIRDGCYCGRRFDCDGMQAVWFVEEQQIKLYDREGQLFEVLGVQELSARRVA